MDPSLALFISLPSIYRFLIFHFPVPKRPTDLRKFPRETFLKLLYIATYFFSQNINTRSWLEHGW